MLLSNSRQFLFCFLNLVSADADSSTFSHSTTSSELAVATTVSTPACSNNVTISLPSFPIIFPLGVSSITQTLPIDISGCSDSVSSCLLSTSDTNIRIVSSTSIQLFPNQTTGPVSSQISCQQGSSNASFVFYIVNPKNLQKLAQVVIPSVSDCITTRLDTAMLNVTDDGGVLNSMIRIIPSAAVDGDILQVSTPVPGFPSGAFSMQSIIDGHVSVSPTRLNTVGQIKSISIPIVISDPSGSRNIRSDVKFTVMHTFCPLLKTASVLRSYQGAPVIFNSSHVSIVEPHGLSLWDFEWMIPVVKHGVLEYYCPDVYCTPTPPKWLSINSETSIIKQAWILIGGLRWNPDGYTGQDFQISFVARTAYASYPSPIELNVTVSINGILNNATILPPYSQDVKCPLYEASMTGFVDLETVNFGSFSAYSPLRPFCGKLDSTSDARLLGGFTVTTPLSTQVTISGGVFLNANLKYPSGFRTLKFTGSGNTLVGTIFQAFKVDIESPNIPLTLEMPQVAYPQNFGTLGQYDIILLEYQPKTGRFSFSSTAKGWIISSASPPILQIQTLIPHSGTYTLGYINSTEVYDVDLPVEYDAYFVVIPVQKQTNFSIIDDSFNAVFKAEEPFVVSMAKPTSLYPNPYGYKILFIVYVKVRDVQDGKSELQKMVLKKQSIKNSKWVYLEPSILGQAWNYTAGSTVVETIRNTTYASVETNKFGLWALMQPPVSACLKVTTGNVLVIAVGFWSVYAV